MTELSGAIGLTAFCVLFVLAFVVAVLAVLMPIFVYLISRRVRECLRELRHLNNLLRTRQ